MNDNQTTSTNPPLTPPPYPNLSQTWWLLGLFFVFALALELFTYPLSSPKFEPIKGWVTLFTYVGSFVLLFLYISQRLKFVEQPFKIKLSKQPFVLFVLLFFIPILLSTVIDPITTLIPMPDAMEKLLKDMVQPNLASFLTVVIAAPICEEVLCRGVILEGLLKNKMNPRSAIMWSAFIFAVLHLNPWQGIPAFLIGCVMGWVYYETKSLLLPIFIHFANNGVAFLVLVAVGNPDVTTEQLVGERNYMPVYIGSVILLAALLYILYWYFKSKDLKQQGINV